MSRRLVLLALPLLLVAGCAHHRDHRGAGAAQRNPASQNPAERFATNVEAADQAVERAILRMDAFERLAGREDSAISYAVSTGRTPAPQLLPAAGGVGELTGRVLAPAFTALGDYGHVLAQAAVGTPIQAKRSPPGAELAASAGRALDALKTTAGVTLTPAVREAGLAAITHLADLPETMTKERGTRPGMAAVVTAAQPHVHALTTMLREVLGTETSKGVRSVIRTRRVALNEAHGRFLSAVQRDRTAGPADRYAIFRTVAELREGDPAPGTLAQLVTLLASLSTAHDALDEGAADAAAKVAGFEDAVEHLAHLGEQSRRAGE